MAIAVLASQMLAGLCALDASARTGGNACCMSGAKMCAGQGCDCCHLDSSSLPSLAAANPSKVSRPIIVATLPILFAELKVANVKVQSSHRIPPLGSPSPPKLYVLNSTFLI